MLAKHFGVICSLRCESVLALAYLRSRKSLHLIANCLAQDRERSAICIAQGLLKLPERQAIDLARLTLLAAGVSFEGRFADE